MTRRPCDPVSPTGAVLAAIGCGIAVGVSSVGLVGFALAGNWLALPLGFCVVGWLWNLRTVVHVAFIKGETNQIAADIRKIRGQR